MLDHPYGMSIRLNTEECASVASFMAEEVSLVNLPGHQIWPHITFNFSHHASRFMIRPITFVIARGDRDQSPRFVLRLEHRRLGLAEPACDRRCGIYTTSAIAPLNLASAPIQTLGTSSGPVQFLYPHDAIPQFWSGNLASQFRDRAVSLALSPILHAECPLEE